MVAFVIEDYNNLFFYSNRLQKRPCFLRTGNAHFFLGSQLPPLAFALAANQFFGKQLPHLLPLNFFT